MNRDRVDVIDLLKGIAILMVITVHTSQRFLLPPTIKNISSLGQFGCQIFLVCSGFLMCYSWKKNANYFRFFIDRRLAKIAPGYYVAILLAILLPVVERVAGTDTSPSIPGGVLSSMHYYFMA